MGGEVGVLVQRRQQRRVALAHLAEAGRIAAVEVEDPRHHAREGGGLFVLGRYTTQLGMVTAERLAEDLAQGDREGLQALLVLGEVHRLVQRLDHQHVATGVVIDEARHQLGQRLIGGIGLRQAVALRLAPQGHLRLGLAVLHLLDEEAGRVGADHFEITVAAAHFGHQEITVDNGGRLHAPPGQQVVGDIRRGQKHDDSLSPINN